jgi:hypothetical protein
MIGACAMVHIPLTLLRRCAAPGRRHHRRVGAVARRGVPVPRGAAVIPYDRKRGLATLASITQKGDIEHPSNGDLAAGTA